MRMRGLHGGSPKVLSPQLSSVHNLRCLLKEFLALLVIHLKSTLSTPTLPSPPQSPGPFHLQLAALDLLQASQIGGVLGPVAFQETPESHSQAPWQALVFCELSSVLLGSWRRWEGRPWG